MKNKKVTTKSKNTKPKTKAKKPKIEVIEHMTTHEWLQSLPNNARVKVMQFKMMSGIATGMHCTTNGQLFLLPSTDYEPKKKAKKVAIG